MTNLTLFLPNEVATQGVARVFSTALLPGTILWLQGDLGAGKTTFIRALLRSLGVTGSIKSPTFALVEPYTITLADGSSQAFHHFDFYRCTAPHEWRDAGFAEYFEPPALAACEWPDRQADLPVPAYTLALSVHDQGRQLRIDAHSPVAAQCLTTLIDLLRRAAAS
jgi:tRNA threonylcarbamoyladenosine biosynthesis protein TsaE